jgi:hypothetical protein
MITKEIKMIVSRMLKLLPITILSALLAVAAITLQTTGKASAAVAPGVTTSMNFASRSANLDVGFSADKFTSIASKPANLDAGFSIDGLDEIASKPANLDAGFSIDRLDEIASRLANLDAGFPLAS